MACTIDFRNLDEGFGGKTYKRKRESQSLLSSAADAAATTTATTTAATNSTMEVDDENDNPPAKRSAVSSSSDPNKPIFGQPTYDGVIAGKVSGRNWKQPRQRASSRSVTLNPPSLEQRMREKEMKKAYKERKEELKEEIRRNKNEKRKLREESEKKKKENILRSGTKLQKITNPKTLKKIAKSKQKKQLKVVSDDFLKNKK